MEFSDSVWGTLMLAGDICLIYTIGGDILTRIEKQKLIKGDCISGPCQRSRQQAERRSGETEENQSPPWSQALLGVRSVWPHLGLK